MDLSDEILSPVQWLLGALVGALAWFFKRELNRIDRGIHDVEESLENRKAEVIRLQATQVTRDDFDELRSSMMASIVHGFERMEERVETRHKENKTTLDAIQNHILALWSRHSDGRET